MWVAIRYQIPLIIWGEPSSEYTSYYSYDQPEEVDEKRLEQRAEQREEEGGFKVRVVVREQVHDRDTPRPHILH